jgi:hypothetical protein
MNDRECENALVALMEYKAFEVVSKCIQNRRKVVFCTRLARASADERGAIEKEMLSDPVLRTVLDRLHHTDTAADRMKQKERALQMEVQKLRGDGGSNSGYACVVCVYCVYCGVCVQKCIAYISCSVLCMKLHYVCMCMHVYIVCVIVCILYLSLTYTHTYTYLSTGAEWNPPMALCGA